MFHKFAVVFNVFILGLPWVVYLLATPCIKLVELSEVVFTFLISNISLATLLFITHLSIVAVLFSVLFIVISSSLSNIKVGPPPQMRSSTIAYKFGLSNTVTSSIIHGDNAMFPKCDKLQIYYDNKGPHFGIAHGAVISDQVNENEKAQLAMQGYNVFHTNNVSNALYVSCPRLPWLSYFGIWLILFIVYPRFYKFSKIHRLSAYPVVEMYRSYSVILIAPLSKQDLFFVPEAEPLLNRSCSEANSSFSAITNLSLSSIRISRSQSTISNMCTSFADIASNDEPVHASTPIHSNGNVKQGYED